MDIGQTTVPADDGTPTPVTPAGAKNTDTPPAEHMVPKSRFDEVNAKLKQLETQAADADKVRVKADRETAERNGEWQKLADQRAARIAELEPVYADATSKLQRYEAALNSQLAALRKDVPKHVVALLDKLDVAEQLEWLAANREQLKPHVDGVPSTPKPAGGMDAQQQEAARQVSANFYRDF